MSNYKFKEIITSNDKKIHVHDNMFTYHEISSMNRYMRNGVTYAINGSDDSMVSKNDGQIFTNLDANQYKKLGLRNNATFQELEKKYDVFRRQLRVIRINVSNVFEEQNIHTDSTGLTFLYYANMIWKTNWCGHTIFMDDDLEEPEYVSLYKPGRLIVFDSSIPHMILTPNFEAKSHRLSLVMQFSEIQEQV